MTARSGAAPALEPGATLEPTAAARPAVIAGPLGLAPTVVIRLGGVVVPVVRPADAAEVVLESETRLGPLRLRSVDWSNSGPSPPSVPPEMQTEDAPRRRDAVRGDAAVLGAAMPTGAAPAGPMLVGGVEAPYVEGSAAIELDPNGTPSGSLRLDGRIGLPGAAVATFSYASTAWKPTAPVPVPVVEREGDRLTIAVDGADRGDVLVEGEDVRPAGDGRWSVPLPATFLTALGAAAAPSEPEPVGMDRLAAARSSLAEQPSERETLADPARAVLEAILGIDLTAIGVHVDPPAQRAAAAAGAPAFTLGSDAYFGLGAFGTDRPDLAQLLGGAIAQALDGLSEVVLPRKPVADPTQERSQVAPSAAVAPPAPSGPPPDTAGIAAEATVFATETAAQTAEQQAAPPVPAGEAAPEAAEEREAEPGASEVVTHAVAAQSVEQEAPAPIDLIMPPAPTAPGPAQQERIAGVARGAGSAARRAATLPSAEETTAAARGAVTEPPAETAARAENAVAQALGNRAEPSPQIVALCDRIRTSIRERRPIDEDEAARSNSQRVAQEAGDSLNANIESDAERVEGSYAPLNDPPAGTPALHPTPVQAPPATVQPTAIEAEGGAPDPVSPDNLSLDADRQATEASVEASGINQPSAQPIQESPFTTVREGQAELATLAENGPAQVAARQQETIDRSSQDMAMLQLQAVEALNASRAATVGGVSRGQTRMIGSEEHQREAISQQAQTIFAEAQAGVTATLSPLQANAMAQWDAGIDRLSTEFHDHLAMVRRWIEDRHSGVGGWFVSGWDALTGLPDDITDEYTRAEKAFGDGVCDLLLRISSDVNTVIAAAEALIESARERINQLFEDLPTGLREWATQEQARFNTQLDGLHEQAAAARTSFVDGISQKAVTAVAEVQAEVERLREEAKGLIGKIADAIQAFIDDPIRAIINGLLNLVGIPPPRFWALVDKIAQVISDIADDPMGFVNNLVDALRQGFQQFFDNFGTHVLQGFWNWLFSGLGSVGVQLPKDMSVGSLVTFALQVMGITWPNIRKILVKYIGEENIALIEQAWQLVSTLIEKGPSGILEMIKERLAPAVLLETILKAAIDYLIDALIKQVVVRLIGMLNPAGAIAQAIQLIYTVLKWIFQNAARIFSLVETVVGAMADVIVGNLSAVANAVEKALAMLIPPVIDFFAEWLGFGDLPIKIADVIKSLQERVLAVIDQIIGWLVEQAKALLAAVGLGGDEAEEEPGAAEEDIELGKVIRFSATGEQHRLWIELVGTQATPMVASFQLQVAAQLVAWRDEKPSRFPDEHPELAEVDALLALAESQLAELDEEADELAPEFAAAQSAPPAAEGESLAPALPSDAAVEAEEQTLSTTLNRLFELFGGEDREQLVARIQAALPRHAAAQVDKIHPHWWDRVGTIKIGNQPDDPPLWPSFSVLSGTTASAMGFVEQETTHEQLLPWFTTAPGEREATTAAFADYAFVSDSTGHDVRQDFRELLGSAALASLKAAAFVQIASATHVDPTYKEKLRTHLDRVTYVWDSPGGGRFVFWTDRVPDHTRYRPMAISVEEQNGIRTTTYRTVTGQEFIITTPVDEGLTITVKGLGLRRMSGRGVTQDSPWFTSGQGFNRAHVVANEFGGSGFSEGLNLVTTSAHYNQVEMRRVELDIGASIVNFADDHRVDPRDVTFDLTVTVRLGALRDPALLARIKLEPWFSRDAATDLDAEIVAKINSGEVVPDLLRVVGVDYSWRSVTPPGLSGNARLGEDLWLLSGEPA